VPSLSRSLLLDTLPPDVRSSLQAQESEHRLADVLIKADENSDFIFFPHTGALVSIIRSTESGAMVEVGVIGGEGVFNVHSFLTQTPPTGCEALVQGEGRFSQVKASRIKDLFRSSEPFRELSLEYTSIFLDQVTQNALCNRLHPIEQRLAKWLLIVRERVGNEDLQMTHDFLAHMLGVHRPGVSIAVNALAQDAVIESRRNHIIVRDVVGLKAKSCECHGSINDRLRAFSSKLGKRSVSGMDQRLEIRNQRQEIRDKKSETGIRKDLPDLDL
jgi:CRP-like cAMP-binding protein